MLAILHGAEIADTLKWILIIAGIAAIALIVVRAMGWQVPSWFWQILLVIALVVVGVLAIRFLVSL